MSLVENKVIYNLNDKEELNHKTLEEVEDEKIKTQRSNLNYEQNTEKKNEKINGNKEGRKANINNTSILNASIIHGVSTVSKLEKVEQEYFNLMKEFDILNNMASPSSKKENHSYLKILDSLNQIVSTLVESKKIKTKKTLPPITKKTSLNIENNHKDNEEVAKKEEEKANKLLEIYRNEFSSLEAKAKKLSDEVFTQGLENDNQHYSNEINNLEKKIRKIKQSQKQSDASITRKVKKENGSNDISVLSKYRHDYESLLKQNDSLNDRISNLNNQHKQINNTLNEKQISFKSFEEIADKSNLKDFDEEAIKSKKEKLLNLNRKVLVLEKQLSSLKKKSEASSTKNAKENNRLKEEGKYLKQKLMELEQRQGEQKIELFKNDDTKIKSKSHSKYSTNSKLKNDTVNSTVENFESNIPTVGSKEIKKVKS